MYVGFGSILSLHVCLRITLPYSPPLSVSLALPPSLCFSLSLCSSRVTDLQ